MKPNSRRIIFLLIIFLFLFSFSLTFAQQKKKIEFFVGPAIFNIQLEKGQTYNGKILLKNKNNFSLPVKSQLINFNARDELGAVNFEKREGANWFKVKRTDFILKPKEERRINFQIKIPKDVSRGGYYVAWNFQPKVSSLSFKRGSTILVPKVSSLFLISVGKKGKANFKIVEFKIPEKSRFLFFENNPNKNKKFVVKSAKFPFVFRIKNNDTYHIRISGALEVFGKNKKSIGKAEVQETTVLPGKTRQISLNFKTALYEKLLDKKIPIPLAEFFSENFYFGKHKAVLILNRSSPKKVYMEITIIPWKGILTILLLLVLMCFIIIKHKKKNKKQERIAKKKPKSKERKTLIKKKRKRKPRKVKKRIGVKKKKS
jgi:hypothetical protein